MSPPADVKNRIEKAQHQLRRTLPGNTIRWTKREQFHVTLKFLGNVAATRVGELTEALRNVCLGAGALRLRAERIGFFPGARVPRVLWVGVQDRQNLLPRLQARVEIGVKEFTKDEAAKPGSAGVSPASREKFTGHITLARIPRLRHSESEILSQAIADFADPFFGEWTANHVELIRSELSSSGSRYTTLAEIPLSEIQ